MSDVSGLRVDNISVRFGGLHALAGVSLEAPVGRMTGLIGPNGAGKSTLFNVCSGLVRPNEGRVFLDGGDVTHVSVSGRAARGLGRTFQLIDLFDSLSVMENVVTSIEARQGVRRWMGTVCATRSEVAEARSIAEEVIAECGLTDVAQVIVKNLSTGRRRLVELARALGGRFEMLLLDEPSSGLDRNETKQFAAILKNEMAKRPLGVLLVEHDMELIAELCDYVYVLDFGKLIFQGTMAEVMASEQVRDAYLGTGLSEVASA